MILVIGQPGNEQVSVVVAELRGRGNRVSVFDLSDLPSRCSVSVALEPGADMRSEIVRPQESMDLSEVTTVWMHRVGTPEPPELSDRWFAVSECHHLLVGLAQALADRRWVNPLAALAMDGGHGKIRQLQAAQAVGLEIPRTLFTNDPQRAREFVASCSAGAVYKPFASREGLSLDGQWTAIFTTEVVESSDFSSVAFAPVILQERIPKRVELRVTVFGDRMFACEIESQADPASVTDYRHRYTSVPRRSVKLPEAIEHQVLDWHRNLGLVHGTADLIQRPDLSYVALETNQAGMWLWTADVAEPGEMVGVFCDLLCG